ncbi:hypothetical protein SALBM311S_10710 [Streptomyces alboniger]
MPGQLVQWVSMFERNKVYANQAYWDAAGNMDGNVVRSNIPNGGWWFFRWYAGLTGDTVKVTPPQADTIDTLQGLASLDTSRRQAQVLLGGSAGDSDVVVRGVSRSVFGRTVTATVAEAAWSGYEGQHATPRVLARTKVEVAADGSVTVPLRGLHKMSAYRLVLTPGGFGSPSAASVPWSASYEAEDAAITGGQVHTQGTVSNANGYAASGTKDVGSLNQASSKVDFSVTVPRTGTYDLAILYGNQSGAPATQKLSVDGATPVTVTYPSTENWTYRAKKDLTVRLTAGTHVLSLAKGDAEVTLDRVDLSARTGAPSASYEATLADIDGKPSYDYSSSAGVGTGALVLRGGDKAVFDVYAPRDGYYTVVSRASAAVRLSLHGQRVTAAPGRPLRLYLVAGNNRVAGDRRARLGAFARRLGRRLGLRHALLRGRLGHPRGRREARRLRARLRRVVHRAARQQRRQHRRVHGARACVRPLSAGRPLRAQRPARQRPRVQHGHHVPYGGCRGGKRRAQEDHVQEHLERERLLDAGHPRRPAQGRQQCDVRQRERVGAEHRPDRAGPGRRPTVARHGPASTRRPAGSCPPAAGPRTGSGRPCDEGCSMS